MENLKEIMMNMQASDSQMQTCEICNGKKQMVIEMLGKKIKVPVMCQCEAEKWDKAKEQDAIDEKIQRLEKLRKHSLMDKQFEKCTFENFEVDESNKNVFNIAKRYTDKFKEIEENNIGLIFHGPTGTGKTYLAFCIANELISKMKPVIAISSIGLLGRIKETYKKNGSEGEVEIINSLKNASLLILDDLGAENSTAWAKETLYEIIDSRYRDKKPIIITTNLSLEQLKQKMASDDGIYRTYDRIIEMCTPIEVKGRARRVDAAKEKENILKDILQG